MVEGNHMVLFAMDAEYRNVALVQLMKVINSAPHVGDGPDSHFVAVFVATRVKPSHFFHQFVLFHKRRAIVISHERGAHCGDGACTCAADEYVIGVKVKEDGAEL